MFLTSLYTSLLALIFIILSVRIIFIRRANRVPNGDNNNLSLHKAIRAHGNFIENIPIILILMFCAENNGASNLLLHIVGVALLLARILHGYGISAINEDFRFRIVGTILTIFLAAFLVAVNLLLFFLK